MIVEQIWTANALRNFNYLIACPETGAALAIDPLDFKQCLSLARQRGWDITQVVNTHEHPDHIGGNKGMIAATGAKLIAHHLAGQSIRNVDRGVKAGDIIKVGKSVELECMDTPGHTMSHICLMSKTDSPALFSGDTLFNAGAGNCHNGGHPEQLFETFEEQLETLGDDTRLYPGHDYLLNNLAFTIDREPDNADAKNMLQRLQGMDPANAPVTTLADERRVNSFFRLSSASIVAKLQSDFPEIGDSPTPRQVFLKLRELRNNW